LATTALSSLVIIYLFQDSATEGLFGEAWATTAEQNAGAAGTLKDFFFFAFVAAAVVCSCRSWLCRDSYLRVVASFGSWSVCPPTFRKSPSVRRPSGKATMMHNDKNIIQKKRSNKQQQHK